MNWTNLIWLGLGFGFGLVSRWRWRRPLQEVKPILPDRDSGQLPARNHREIPDSNDNQKLSEHLKQITLAYQMATEMSAFKGGFLARASHELRSPLNGLIGMHQLILSDLCDSAEEEREFIAQANESARKMVDVLDKILDVARVQHGTVKMEIQPTQLTQILQEVHDLTYLQARNRNLQLQIPFPDADLYVLTDPHRFRQILIYLIDFAISRAPESGITVSTRPSPKSGYIDIWIDDHCSAAARSEPVNLITDANLDPAVFSSGLNLLAAQTLLQLMQGHLEIVSVSPESEIPSNDPPLTRVQCSIPMVRE
ncbi:MAG: HAMP domain-containing sensor histidine kinase [Kovacikia sp.]